MHSKRHEDFAIIAGSRPQRSAPLCHWDFATAMKCMQCLVLRLALDQLGRSSSSSINNKSNQRQTIWLCWTVDVVIRTFLWLLCYDTRTKIPVQLPDTFLILPNIAKGGGLLVRTNGLAWPCANAGVSISRMRI